jgi:hypothetical protein
LDLGNWNHPGINSTINRDVSRYEALAEKAYHELDLAIGPEWMTTIRPTGTSFSEDYAKLFNTTETTSNTSVGRSIKANDIFNAVKKVSPNAARSLYEKIQADWELANKPATEPAK